MSMPIDASVTCNSCGHTQPFTVWTTLNVTLDPEQKQELLKGTLTRSTCGQCGTSANVLYRMLYHDMDRKFMVWLWPTSDDPAPGDADPFRMMRDLRFRIVSTLNELVEKVLLFDHECDDREIEIFKFLLRAQHETDSAPFDGTLYFLGIHPGEDGGDILGFEHVTESGSESFGVPMSVYRDVVAFFRRDIALAEPKPGTWLRVDADFVQALLSDSPPPPTGSQNPNDEPPEDRDEEPF